MTVIQRIALDEKDPVKINSAINQLAEYLDRYDPANAGSFTSGLVALARGGTHADLSATGGTSKFLRQNSSGADITIVQPASTDLSDTTAPTSFSPADNSGAGLTFTSVNVQYTKVGNIVYMYGTITYPATADATGASITLPVAVPAGSYAAIGSICRSPTVTSLGFLTSNGSSAGNFYNIATGAAVTNATLSLALLRFMVIYPAT